MTLAVLWLRAHRWPTLIALCCGVAVLGVVFGDDVVPVPSLTSVRRISVSLGQLLPLVLACAVGLHGRTPTSLFAVVPRSHSWQRFVLATVLLATVGTTCLAVPEWLSALRNTLGLAGLALGTAALAGATRAWTTPLFYLMACLLFGTEIRTTAAGEAGPQPWAFALAAPGDDVALLLALACCVLGTAFFVVRGPRPDGGR